MKRRCFYCFFAVIVLCAPSVLSRAQSLTCSEYSLEESLSGYCSPWTKYHLLGPGQTLDPTLQTDPNPIRYYLLDDAQRNFFEDAKNREWMNDLVGKDNLERALKKPYLTPLSEEDMRIIEGLGTIHAPTAVSVTQAMLEYLKIKIEDYVKYNEEKRFREFCRYRIAIYRKDNIMYPKECIGSP